jgi:hypothetical protein
MSLHGRISGLHQPQNIFNRRPVLDLLLKHSGLDAHIKPRVGLATFKADISVPGPLVVHYVPLQLFLLSVSKPLFGRSGQCVPPRKNRVILTAGPTISSWQVFLGQLSLRKTISICLFGGRPRVGGQTEMKIGC